jgi:hypothetical protein
MTSLLGRVEIACADAFLAYGENPTDAAMDRVAELGEAHRLLSELPVLAVLLLQAALDAAEPDQPAAQAVAAAAGLNLWLCPWLPCPPSPDDARALGRLRVLARVLGAGPGPVDRDLASELTVYGAVELLDWRVAPDVILTALRLRPRVLKVLRGP